MQPQAKFQSLPTISENSTSFGLVMPNSAGFLSAAPRGPSSFFQEPRKGGKNAVHRMQKYVLLLKLYVLLSALPYFGSFFFCLLLFATCSVPNHTEQLKWQWRQVLKMSFSFH
jgi:hypothetical protein